MREGDVGTIEIRAGRVTAALAAAAALVVLAGIAVAVARVGYGHDTLLGVAARLDLDREANLPAWFSSTLLSLAALAAFARAAVARGAGERGAHAWLAFGAVIAAMSLDETAQIHELVGFIGGRLLPEGAMYFHFKAILPGLVVVLALSLALRSFVRALDGPTRARFVVAACFFFGGAMGVEMIGSGLARREGFDSARYIVVCVVEESCEMTGVILMIRALLLNLEARCGAVTIRLISPSSSPGGGSPP